MTINDFATQQCLKTKQDKGDDTTIIPGIEVMVWDERRPELSF